jgi:hypothetical protein
MQQPPYGQSGFVPPPGYGSANLPPGTTDDSNARSQVGPPAIALMVASGVTFFWYLGIVVLMLFAGGMAALDPGGGGDPMSGLLGGAIAALVYGFFALMALLSFVGAFRMRQLKSYGLAMASAIIAMIPCTTYMCCLLMLPMGIWALTVLMKPEVKSAFR